MSEAVRRLVTREVWQMANAEIWPIAMPGKGAITGRGLRDVRLNEVPKVLIAVGRITLRRGSANAQQCTERKASPRRAAADGQG